MDVYVSRLEELFQRIEEKLKEIPYIDDLLAIKGIGMMTVSGFIAEVGDIRRFDNPKLRTRYRKMPISLAHLPEI